MSERIVVLGAGPTGLGAAWRLAEHGHEDWRVLESGPGAGGLAMSVVDDAGFTWDLGGHVLFSHYEYFDRLMDQALGSAWLEHQREAWVWMRQRWVPYPLQNNIWRLPDETLIACLEGLVAVAGSTPAGPPEHFGAWLERAFGRGLCEAFMFPYNAKVWAYPPESMGTTWMGERVATVDLARVLRNLVLKRDDVSWGPNATFRFPERGGTGAIWVSLANQLPADRFRFNAEVARIDTAGRVLHLRDGSTEAYDTLISSMPLDNTLRMAPDLGAVGRLADQFVHSSSHIVGVGLAGQPPADLATKCWMYFPEPDTPFYRVTVFSNYSPNNVARPGEQWSLMAEVSESPVKPVDAARIIDDVIEGFRTVGFIGEGDAIVSCWHRRLGHGYPTPWRGRDPILAEVQAALEARGILSRGRFGAWKYEVSNQDHSAMQGVEAVDRLLLGTAESTVHGGMNSEPPALAARMPSLPPLR